MVDSIFEDVHSQRLEALGNYSSATMRAMRAGVHAIGAAYAETAEIRPKHGIKQFDRFLSNKGLDVERLRPSWARFVLSGRPEVLLAMDWTDFDRDDHTTLCIYVVTTHGRATPLAWQTHKKSELREQRTAAEHALIESVHASIPPEVRVTLLADRGFGDQVLYGMLDLLGWSYVIRFRGGILVEHEGVQRPASAWLAPNGRARKLDGARVTADRTQIGAVVTVHAKAMKEPWCLATNLATETAAAIVKLYGRRFTIEETFRDEKEDFFRVWQADEATYFAEFLREKDGTDISRWLYNQGRTAPGRPGDLGYFIGYRIAQAYYLKATDKAQAIRDLITLRDPAALLVQSGYAGSGPPIP